MVGFKLDNEKLGWCYGFIKAFEGVGEVLGSVGLVFEGADVFVNGAGAHTVFSEFSGEFGFVVASGFFVYQVTAE